MGIERQIEDKAKQIEALLKTYLPKEEGYQKTVLEAMNYSLLAGGKRLRPMLMQETYRMLGGMGHVVEPFMAAIEMIHTYSLVHDDLPAMDNDEYRRGRKTTHVVYGEDMAILAGDGLLNYAFETAMKAFDSCIVDEIKLGDRYEMVARALKVLGHKAGIYGMIGGQTADVEAENKEESLTGEQLLFIHQHKTAALIEASMMIGGILSGADQDTIDKLEKCAYDLGVAFQIQDDILDVIGDEATLGKPIGSDARNGKQTYVTIYGMEQAKAQVLKLSEEAVYILDTLCGDNQFMKELMTYLIHREK
ncbi:MAG: polyprenyl synthetase family protein [Lachnospiraceae bacterium]|nr:polyprenyl synthetase family protein [Lachnospiraceae bacterium]